MSYIKLRKYILGVAVAVASTATAYTLDEAKEMYQAGDFAGALPVFEEALASKPKDPALNQWTGVCLLREGRHDEALPYLKFADTKRVTEAPRYLAEIAFYHYALDEADEYIDKYEASLKKSRKQLPEDMDILRERIGMARAMLDRVEKIVIIDSVAVDRDQFFKAYRLAPESGSVNSTEVLPKSVAAADPSTVYMPETRNFMIWAAPDSAENFVLTGASRLFDGSWETPAPLGSVLDLDGDSNYPFMMPDGVTLYYANNGEESLGGYDIFISRKDEDGFLQPQNIGMPYNSPYDDYLLAIDEVTGVGWWATDRNRLGDYITIYKFIPSDLRNNYPVDYPELTDMARITDYKSTWEDGKDYADLLDAIKEIDPDKKLRKPDFRFALGQGRVYISWNDFKNPRARKLMKRYLDDKKHLDGQLATLEKMRRQYRDGDTSLKTAILNMEAEIDNARSELKKSANDVIAAEN